LKLYNLVKAEARCVRRFRIYAYLFEYSKPLSLLLYNMTKIKYGVDIAPTAIIGKNFKIVHIGGVVIGGNVIIADNVTIQNGVTLGMKDSRSRAMPNVQADVYIGTGAKILGGVVVGHGSIIGANSVVISDVEPNSIYAGVPAKKVGIVDKHE